MFGLAHLGQQLSQLAPPSALLHTPPAAAPASRRRGSVAWATSAVTRPAMLNGPMHSHFPSLGSKQACARSFQNSSSSPAWVSCSVWLARCANHALRSEEHTSELQSLRHLVCRLLLEKI